MPASPFRSLFPPPSDISFHTFSTILLTTRHAFVLSFSRWRDPLAACLQVILFCFKFTPDFQRRASFADRAGLSHDRLHVLVEDTCVSCKGLLILALCSEACKSFTRRRMHSEGER